MRLSPSLPPGVPGPRSPPRRPGEGTWKPACHPVLALAGCPLILPSCRAMSIWLGCWRSACSSFLREFVCRRLVSASCRPQTFLGRAGVRLGVSDSNSWSPGAPAIGWQRRAEGVFPRGDGNGWHRARVLPAPRPVPRKVPAANCTLSSLSCSARHALLPALPHRGRVITASAHLPASGPSVPTGRTP